MVKSSHGYKFSPSSQWEVSSRTQWLEDQPWEREEFKLKIKREEFPSSLFKFFPFPPKDKSCFFEEADPPALAAIEGRQAV